VTAKPGITRRVLLTGGGLTLLAAARGAGRGQQAAARPADPAAPGPRPRRDPRPGTAAPSGDHSAVHAETVSDVGRPVYYIHDGPRAIALTIDDGPSPVYTPQILHLLARYRVTASFSMIGAQVDEYPALVREVAAAGHVILNHTWRHLDLPALPGAAVRAEMDRATDAIHHVTGRVPRFFRAPYGAWSPLVFEHCENTGMTPVDWSVDPRDWARPGVREIVGNILGNTRTGSIILEHDGGGNRSETVAALKIVIPRLLDAGFHFRAL
jgi:peptidoglycan-N-acetylglucosamine deacetylase